MIIFHRRMDYSEAIEYLRENNITKDDGTFYEFGEVQIMYTYTLVIHSATLTVVCMCVCRTFLKLLSAR